jgi:putative glutamine amidotransferase
VTARERLPRVGISACFMHPDDERLVFKGKTLLYVEQSMAWWVQSGGAVAYLIPTAVPGSDIGPYVDDLDGLLLHGGADVCPRTYGEEPLEPEWEGDAIRDAYELELTRAFIDAGKPVLGICRGHQILNVAFGGTLWQDQREQGATDRVHRSQELYDHNVHRVDLEPGSALAALYPGRTSATVNSIHHQAVKDVGDGLVVEARSDDGLVEALRAPDAATYVASVQWHPEFMFRADLPKMDGVQDWLDNAPILAEFLAVARSRP